MAPGGFSGKDIALLGELVNDDDDAEMDELYLMGQDVRATPRRLVTRDRRSASRVFARQRARATQKVAEAISTPLPGQPEVGPRYIPLPFPAVQFVNLGPTAIQTVARTQKAFKGVRLIIVEARSAATVTGLLTLTQFAVGTDPQSVALNPIPAAAFGPGAFQVDLALSPVEPGVDFTIQYSLSATPPVGETLDVATVVLGLALAA